MVIHKKIKFFLLIIVAIIFTLNACNANASLNPEVKRFEWYPAKTIAGEPSTFYWDVRNVQRCYTTTSGAGSAVEKPIQGAIGPSIIIHANVLTSRWYCIDLTGKRFPSNPNEFLEATRTTYAAPVANRFEWSPAKVTHGQPSTFFWDVRNTQRCYSTTTGAGAAVEKPVQGAIGPVVMDHTNVLTSRWYCIDLAGNRFPKETNKFLEAKRTTYAPPVVKRFEWFPSTVEIGNQASFIWDIENAQHCVTTTAGNGSIEDRPVKGQVGPVTVTHTGTVTSRWYCIDSEGQRFPFDNSVFLTAQRKDIEKPDPTCEIRSLTHSSGKAYFCNNEQITQTFSIGSKIVKEFEVVDDIAIWYFSDANSSTDVAGYYMRKLQAPSLIRQVTQIIQKGRSQFLKEFRMAGNVAVWKFTDYAFAGGSDSAYYMRHLPDGQIMPLSQVASTDSAKSQSVTSLQIVDEVAIWKFINHSTNEYAYYSKALLPFGSSINKLTQEGTSSKILSEFQIVNNTALWKLHNRSHQKSTAYYYNDIKGGTISNLTDIAYDSQNEEISSFAISDNRAYWKYKTQYYGSSFIEACIRPDNVASNDIAKTISSNDDILEINIKNDKASWYFYDGYRKTRTYNERFLPSCI